MIPTEASSVSPTQAEPAHWLRDGPAVAAVASAGLGWQKFSDVNVCAIVDRYHRRSDQGGSNDMKVYVHREAQADAEAVEVSGDMSLSEALGAGDGSSLAVLLEDSEDALDLALRLEEAGVEDRAHVFVGARQRILVEVMYNGETRQKKFSASTRVERVFRWASGKNGFDLDRADAAEHTLALCSTGEVPAQDVHLGSLDVDTPGRVCFTLIPKHRFEG